MSITRFLHKLFIPTVFFFITRTCKSFIKDMPWQSLPPLIIICGAFTATGLLLNGIDKLTLGRVSFLRYFLSGAKNYRDFALFSIASSDFIFHLLTPAFFQSYIFIIEPKSEN